MAIGDGPIGSSGAEDLLARIQALVKDTDGKLDEADWDAGISGCLERYSKHRPKEVVVNIAGTGAHDYSAPAEWVPEFSSLKKIEYPVDKVPAEYLDKNDDYIEYESPDGPKIRLITYAPPVGSSFRATYTTLRGADTIAQNDFTAVAHLGAYICLGILASRYLAIGDPTLSADVVNYRSKSAEAAARAKSCLAFYNEHFGITDEGGVPPASVVVSNTLNYPGGGDRLTHPRRDRNRR